MLWCAEAGNDSAAGGGGINRRRSTGEQHEVLLIEEQTRAADAVSRYVLIPSALLCSPCQSHTPLHVPPVQQSNAAKESLIQHCSAL